MKIYDKKNNLIAIVIRYAEIIKGKNFTTDNESEFQLASFQLDKNEEIYRHYHPNQSRSIKTTSEVLVLIEGEILIKIYDYDLNFLEEIVLNSGDTIGFFGGGHGLELLRDSKFIEVKQGPYDDETDKKIF